MCAGTSARSSGREIFSLNGVKVRSPGPTTEPRSNGSTEAECGSCELAADEDTVFLATGTSGGGEISTEVTAYAADSGDELWSESFDEARALLRIEQGLVLIGQTIDEVILLDASTGGERWTADGGFGGVYRDDVIIRGEEDALVDASDGEEILSVDGALVGCGPEEQVDGHAQRTDQPGREHGLRVAAGVEGPLGATEREGGEDRRDAGERDGLGHRDDGESLVRNIS